MDASAPLLDKIVEAFAGVTGVRAVVLGGSRARGSAKPDSDFDIGLYYRGVPDMAALERAARSLNDSGARRGLPRPDGRLMWPPGEWGAWVNGGGWLTVDGQPVDILYRDLNRVEGVIDDSLKGAFVCAYHHGHPHAFVSTIYAGEVAIGRPLADPHGEIAAAKDWLDPYPQALHDAIVARFGQEARFFLGIAGKGAARGDVAYVTGCAFRAVSCLLQIVFARNGEWLINEKGAAEMADGFAVKPKDLRARIDTAFGVLPSGADGMALALASLERLIDEAAP